MHIQENSSLKFVDLMLSYTQVWVIKRSLNFKPYNVHRAIGENLQVHVLPQIKHFLFFIKKGQHLRAISIGSHFFCRDEDGKEIFKEWTEMDMRSRKVLSELAVQVEGIVEKAERIILIQ